MHTRRQSSTIRAVTRSGVRMFYWHTYRRRKQPSTGRGYSSNKKPPCS